MTQQDICFSEVTVMVQYRGRVLYGSLYDQITEGEHGPPLKDYLCTKFNWTSIVFDSIDWQAMGVYIKHLTGTKITNLLKMVLHWQNDNQQNDMFYGKDSRCPACGNQDEEHFHFLWCRDPTLYHMNTKFINKKYRELQKTKTSMVITRTFKAIIKAVRGNQSLELSVLICMFTDSKEGLKYIKNL